MLYRIGTMGELSTTAINLPGPVLADLIRTTALLDREYGPLRDYLSVGGYSLIVETEDDLAQLKQIIDYDTHPCEWVTEIEGSGHISVLYLLNDDYSIVVYTTAAIACDIVWSGTED